MKLKNVWNQLHDKASRNWYNTAEDRKVHCHIKFRAITVKWQEYIFWSYVNNYDTEGLRKTKLHALKNVKFCILYSCKFGILPNVREEVKMLTWRSGKWEIQILKNEVQRVIRLLIGAIPLCCISIIVH